MPAADPDLFALAMDHASGENKQKLSLLIERFEGYEMCQSKAAAAAFGYLMAQKEREEKEEEAFSPSIGDEVCTVIEYCRDLEESVEEGMEIIMGLVYGWLRKAFIKEDYCEDDYVMTIIKGLFEPYVKPNVVS